MARLSADEKKWQAQSDARVLAEADIIKNTPTRINASACGVCA